MRVNINYNEKYNIYGYKDFKETDRVPEVEEHAKNLTQFVININNHKGISNHVIEVYEIIPDVENSDKVFEYDFFEVITVNAEDLEDFIIDNYIDINSITVEDLEDITRKEYLYIKKQNKEQKDDIQV